MTLLEDVYIYPPAAIEKRERTADCWRLMLGSERWKKVDLVVCGGIVNALGTVEVKEVREIDAVKVGSQHSHRQTACENLSLTPHLEAAGI
jgi:hypothetical protein